MRNSAASQPLNLACAKNSGKGKLESDLAVLVRNRELSSARTMELAATLSSTDLLVPGAIHGASRRGWERFWRILYIGDVRVRMVEYTPGYLADHWCDRGHILYVVEGELDTELKDGRKFS